MCFEVITASNGFYEKASYYNKGHRTNKIALWSLSQYFKFITNTNNTFDVVRGIRCSSQFPPQITHMVIDGFSGIERIILIPDQFHNKLISKYTLRVSD